VPSLFTSDEEGHDSHSGFCAAAGGGLVRGLTGTTKSTWITRMLPGNLSVQWRESRAPSVGDVLLCEVLSTGLHGRVETAVGARSKLFPGDRIACVVGNRYATSLLEGVGEISGEHADLLSASGVCGRVLARSDKAARPTSLRVLGQGEVDGQPLRLRDHVSPTALAGLSGVVWFVVVGSAMDSGKTTACASLINGLVGAGYRVGAAKLTGTASARDVGSFRDAGAQPVVDFLDEGWPSTVGCSDEELLTLVTSLAGQLAGAGVEVGVLEIADGILQADTDFLIRALPDVLGDAAFVLTARESLAALAGVERLTAMGREVVAISGVLTASPLTQREVTRSTTTPCFATSVLGDELARSAWMLQAVERCRMLPSSVA
jgi:hypothetical protein